MKTKHDSSFLSADLFFLSCSALFHPNVLKVNRCFCSSGRWTFFQSCNSTTQGRLSTSVTWQWSPLSMSSFQKSEQSSVLRNSGDETKKVTQIQRKKRLWKMGWTRQNMCRLKWNHVDWLIQIQHGTTCKLTWNIWKNMEEHSFRNIDHIQFKCRKTNIQISASSTSTASKPNIRGGGRWFSMFFQGGTNNASKTVKKIKHQPKWVAGRSIPHAIKCMLMQNENTKNYVNLKMGWTCCNPVNWWTSTEVPSIFWHFPTFPTADAGPTMRTLKVSPISPSFKIHQKVDVDPTHLLSMIYPYCKFLLYLMDSSDLGFFCWCFWNRMKYTKWVRFIHRFSDWCVFSRKKNTQSLRLVYIQVYCFFCFLCAWIWIFQMNIYIIQFYVCLSGDFNLKLFNKVFLRACPSHSFPPCNGARLRPTRCDRPCLSTAEGGSPGGLGANCASTLRELLELPCVAYIQTTSLETK